MKIPELLAPAGSYDTLIAVCNAGADAVYAAGTKYGARAYANNLSEEELLKAIEYVHLHDKKLYLTLNTLIKDSEFSELYDYLLPLYVKGLDGIIVQDLGVISYLKKQFPNLPVHISTQAAIMGEDSLAFFKKNGAERAVLARELSFNEIKYLRENTDLELEIFVHGALCYSYSGMCFYSSLIGGRSGNRGRCAQPCRMKYSIEKNERDWMSLKDLSAIEYLDKLCEIGIDSLKIEGRMKSTAYAAGVTRIYRKYLDKIKSGCRNYSVSDKDMDTLNKLYQRRGFESGYFFRHNGKEMLLTDDERVHEDTDNLNNPDIILSKIPVDFNAYFSLNSPSVLIVSDNKGNSVTVYGEACTQANKKPLDEQVVAEKLSKVNDTLLSIDSLNIEIDGDLFLPMSSLNELKRKAVNAFIEQIESKYIRETPEKLIINLNEKTNNENALKKYSASFISFSQGRALLNSKIINRVYFPYDLLTNDYDNSINLINEFKSLNIEVYLAMPEIFRKKTRAAFDERLNEFCNIFDGFLIKNTDELYFMYKHAPQVKCISDFTVYAFNRFSIKEINNYFNSFTASIELNYNELKNQDLTNAELIIYGRYPMMFTANCLVKNSGKCSKSKDLYFKDRKGMTFFVKNFCNECYNIIYNTKITSLLGVMDKVDSLNAEYLRFSFTNETEEEINSVLSDLNDPKDFTRGHFIRGVL